VHSQNTPGSRDHLLLVYHKLDNTIYLFGGSGTAEGKYTWNDDTWSWNGTHWEDLKKSKPGNIASMSATYLDHNQTVMMVGGINPAKGDLNETWIWANDNWNLHESNLSVRLSPALAYDPNRNVVTLFSGCVGRKYPTDTWEWKESDWKLISETGPSTGLCRAAMFYDAVRKTTVLFGGITDRGVKVNEMWEWNGKSWKLIDQGKVIPPARTNIQIAYDENRKRAVLFGGSGKEGLLKDTWEWDGNKWIEIKTDVTPSQREIYGITYHNQLKKVFLYGGRIGFAKPQDDFWSWDGKMWTEIK
jgi:hypothetical protein